ncbi:MAG: undecaprenyl-diphosphatase UppP [Candidatus Kapabacteria bacterium]|nr:undecaprenyl-diphosphatase UppP [Candidatus Kapabacteria bacterium]
MNLIKAIILGIIQGLTEFIPISSTAHLTIAGKLMGLIDPAHPENWTAFIAVLQLGTLVSVLIFFAKDIKTISIGTIKETISQKGNLMKMTHDAKMGWYVILGTIPIVTIGLGLKKVIEGNITKEPLVIATSLIVLAIILFFADKYAKLERGMDKLNLKDALIIGLSQCLALFPGASRSGSTIMAGLFLGINREAAARFSFLLSIPAILGSGLLELRHAIPNLQSGDLINLFIATLVSGVVGYVSISFLLKYLRTHNTIIFVIYRIIFGLIIVTLVTQHFI